MVFNWQTQHMNRNKMKLLVILVAIGLTTLCLTSCYAMSNMSTEDAYNVGYGVGTLLRNM